MCAAHGGCGAVPVVVVAEGLLVLMPPANLLQVGTTALMWAAAKGKLDCVSRLLEAGAELEATDKVPLPL